MVKLICLTAAVSLMIFAVGCGPKEESFSEKESSGTQIAETVQTQTDATTEDSTAATEGSTSTTEETTVATTDNGNSDDNNNWTGIY